MELRANWRGYLKIAEVTCPVALYTAASTSDRMAFHTLNRATGHRVQRRFVDSETGKPVEKEDQVKGYERGPGDYVVLEPDEVAAAVPESDKTLSASIFINCSDIDDIYFDKPYYLVPADQAAADIYVLIREGMRAKKVAAVARAVLFRRVRTVLIRAQGQGLIATTLNFGYEVRSVQDAFNDVPDIEIRGEMLQLAEHIIKTKTGKFDPSKYSDRYESALAELVKAKLQGRKIEVHKEPHPGQAIDLVAALRKSAGLAAQKSRSAAATEKKISQNQRKSGLARPKAAS